MPPKLTDDTPLTFLEHNPKRAGSKAGVQRQSEARSIKAFQPKFHH